MEGAAPAAAAPAPAAAAPAAAAAAAAHSVPAAAPSVKRTAAKAGFGFGLKGAKKAAVTSLFAAEVSELITHQGVGELFVARPGLSATAGFG